MNQDNSRRLLKVMEFAPLGLLVLLFLVFSAISPRFMSWENIENILRQSSYIGILAVGMTFVLLTAGIDLSVGSLMYVAAVVLGYILKDTNWGVFWAIACSLLVCAALGMLNALMISRLKVSAFIVTLAALQIWRGAALQVTRSQDVSFPDVILSIDAYRVFGVLPAPLLIFAVIAFLGQTVLSRTGYGRQILAVGQDREAATKAGLPVNRILSSVYVICAVTACLASLISVSQLGVVNAGFAQQIEFNVIAAAVLGGASLFGGRGTVFPGAVIGAVLMQTISSGLVYANVDIYMQPIVTSSIIFLAVLLDSLRNAKVRQLQRKHIRIEMTS